MRVLPLELSSKVEEKGHWSTPTTVHKEKGLDPFFARISGNLRKSSLAKFCGGHRKRCRVLREHVAGSPEIRYGNLSDSLRVPFRHVAGDLQTHWYSPDTSRLPLNLLRNRKTLSGCQNKKRRNCKNASWEKKSTFFYPTRKALQVPFGSIAYTLPGREGSR